MDSKGLDTRERLVFAQVVYEVGTENWGKISDLLSRHPLVTRPKQFYSASSCQSMYTSMMVDLDEKYRDNIPTEVQNPKAKPTLRLAQKYYKARVAELVNLIGKHEDDFRTLTTEMDEIQQGKWDHRIADEFGSPPPTVPNNSTQQGFNVRAAESGVSAEGDVVLAANLDETMDDVDPAVDESFDEPPVAPISTEPDVSHQIVSGQQRQPEAEVEDDEMATEDEIPVAAVRSPPPNTVTKAASNEQGPGARRTTRSRSHSEAGQPYAARHLVNGDDEGAGKEDDSNEAIYDTKMSTRARNSDSVQAAKAKSPSVLMLSSKDDLTLRQSEITAKPEPLDNASVRANSEQLSDGDDDENENEQVESNSGPSRNRPRANRKSAVTPARKPSRPMGRNRQTTTPADDFEDDSTPSGKSRAARRSRAPTASYSPINPSHDQPQPSSRNRAPNRAVEVLHNTIANLKHGTFFSEPVRDANAPGYGNAVYHPTNLKHIHRRIKDSQITTTDEYVRELRVLLANAVMYNSPGGGPHADVIEMLRDVEEAVQSHRNTEQLKGTI